MHTLNPETLPALVRLDELDPLEALQLVREVRLWSLDATVQLATRARLVKHSWRDIDLASGIARETLRRWAAAGVPEHTRRRS